MKPNVSYDSLATKLWQIDENVKYILKPIHFLLLFRSTFLATCIKKICLQYMYIVFPNEAKKPTPC